MKTEVKSKNKKQAKKKVSKKNKNVNKDKVSKKSSKLKKKILLILGLVVVLGVITVLILFSDLFNITKITVTNNSKVATEEIIKNSGFVVGNNMFKIFNSVSKDGIKQNPYIEDVNITRKWSGEVVIEVTERVATYMLQRENEYIYIDNQGYILEVSQTALKIPVIKGYSSKELTPNNRLEVADLEKLDTVIQIMESAKSNKINEKITSVNITDESNFILEIPSEGKTVQFGDGRNINVKVLWIVDLITREKGIDGEIILNVPDVKKVYFREKV